KYSATANKIVENIRELHQTLGFHTGQKSNILALVAGLHSQKSLRYFGFALFYKQYKLVRENAIGSGPVELSGSFYEKFQISDLYFCAVYKKDGHITRKLFGHLSISLTHNSFYNINFFFENHGKSDVDGHFGVLSRWFSDAEAHQNINTITELKECFERKTYADSFTRGSGNQGKYNFKLLASPICSEDLASYNPVAYKEVKISDKRSNKYASDHIQRGSSGDALMRPSYIEIQTKRVGMLRVVRGSGEGDVFLSNDGHCER
ncbi:hypothetical protein BB560_005209, partial [Smittium megazygosporum]